MAEYIEREALLTRNMYGNANPIVFRTYAEELIKSAPAADVVEVDDIKAWLYELALNNVRCIYKDDFSNCCEEIIARLDGLRKFASERREK